MLKGQGFSISMWLTARGIEVSPRDEMPKNPAVARVHDNNGADTEVRVHAIPARAHRDIRKAALKLTPADTSRQHACTAARTRKPRIR
jgi:hypothetical protein